MKNLALRITLLIILIIVGAYAFLHYDLYHFFTHKKEIVNFIRTHPYSEIAFIVLQITQVVAAPVPGELTGFIGGFLYGPVLGTIYSTIGLTLGSWLAFILSHFLGEPLLKKVVKPSVLEKFDHFMEHKGIIVSFFLFLIPGFPKDYLCYIMGVSTIPVGTFLIVSAVGRLFGTIMLSITGSSARSGQYFLLGLFVGAGIIIFIGAYLYHEKILEILKNKSKKPESADRSNHNK